MQNLSMAVFVFECTDLLPTRHVHAIFAPRVDLGRLFVAKRNIASLKAKKSILEETATWSGITFGFTGMIFR